MTTTSPVRATPPETGSEHTVTVHDLALSGGGIARLDGITVFLDGGLPGETLLCRITGQKPRFVQAEVVRTLAPSPHTVPPFCLHREACGGCAWTTFDYGAECAWKERQVKETLRRIGKVTFAAEGADPDTDATLYLPLVPSPRHLGYRNKMEFAFGLHEDSPTLGLRQRNAHTVVPVEECPLSALPLGDILSLTRRWMQDTGLPPWDGKAGFLRFLVVRTPEHTPDGTRRCLVELITAPGDAAARKAATNLGTALMATGQVTGFVHSERAAAANVAYGETVRHAAGETTVTERIGETMLEAPAQAFLQTNTLAAGLLYAEIKSFALAAQPASIWDLYCGVGGIALALADTGATIHGVESVKEALPFARKNAAALGSPITFAKGDAAAALAGASQVPDLVITDPPRAGMTRELTESILNRPPRHLITVSCDPASLARDLAILGGAYRVERVRAVDLFPHTPHVETLALLARK